MIMARAVSGRGVVGRYEPSSPSLNTNRNELHYRFLRIESPQCELFAYRAGNPRTGEDRGEGEMKSGATQHDDGAPKARQPSTGPGMTVPRLTFAEQLVLWSARRLSAAGLGAAATEPARAEDEPAQPVSAPPRARHRSLRPAAAPTLAELAPPGVSNPCIVLLTPGVYNSAFYEHMFLAQEMGVELVQGSDLRVHNGFVYMRPPCPHRRGPRLCRCGADAGCVFGGGGSRLEVRHADRERRARAGRGTPGGAAVPQRRGTHPSGPARRRRSVTAAGSPG